MPHEKGAYLGGIRTVEDLRQRCVVDDVTGCWHWRLCVHQGAPKVHFALADGSKRTMRGRRAALTLARQSELPPGHVTWAAMGCASADCVNPAHAQHGTKAKWGNWIAATDALKGLPTKVRAAYAAHEGRRKLTDEQIRRVIDSNQSCAALAAEFGVSSFCIWRWRTKGGRQVAVPASSVFTWRRAA